jgi:hypothetical protein
VVESEINRDQHKLIDVNSVNFDDLLRSGQINEEVRLKNIAEKG